MENRLVCEISRLNSNESFSIFQVKLEESLISEDGTVILVGLLPTSFGAPGLPTCTG